MDRKDFADKLLSSLLMYVVIFVSRNLQQTMNQCSESKQSLILNSPKGENYREITREYLLTYTQSLL